MWFHYGYFVILPNGIAVPSGDDFAQKNDTYKVGSSMGVKNGKEGIVVEVVKGDAAKLNGFDVMVFIVENEPGAMVPWVPSREAIERAIRGLTAVPESPATIQAVVNDKRMVAIWNRLYPRPASETFHEFLIEVPLKSAFSKTWYKAERSKSERKRHAVEQWLRAFREDQQRHKPTDHKPGQVYRAPATGATTELMTLAHDLYLLQKVRGLPRQLVRRLRNYKEFQGARYEVAIAAAFVKCGFEIEWVLDDTSRHPEFVARNKRTKEEVAVETKSRHRPGALHEAGVLPEEEKLRADIDRLYNDALRQDPGGRPFAVFIDVNLPPNAEPNETVKWRDEIVGRWQNNQQQIALLGFTNFAWHYKPGDPVSRPELLVSVPLASARPLKTPETLRCLQVALDSYGVVPNEY